MKTFFAQAAATALLSLLAVGANAATLVGTFLDGAAFTLIHAGSGPGDAENNPMNFLRWTGGEAVMWDLTGSTLTATGPQDFVVESENNAIGTFTLLAASFDLSDASDGFTSGTLDYNLNVSGGAGQIGDITVTDGQFVFANENFSGFPFNSSTFDGTTFELFAWGGDVANDIGIDLGTNASVVPIPAPLLLFASGLFGLGALRRRR